MTYIRKNLADMLVEIGLDKGSRPNIEDTLITQRGDMCGNAVIAGYLHFKYKPHLEEYIKDAENLKELCNGRSSLAPIGHLMINSFDYAYEFQSGHPIIIRYFFGSHGVVMQVQDFGKGFDANREMGILMGQGQSRDRTIHNRGMGLAFFLNEKYEANIASSQIDPTGTTFTFMYKYPRLDKVAIQ